MKNNFKSKLFAPKLFATFLLSGSTDGPISPISPTRVKDPPIILQSIKSGFRLGSSIPIDLRLTAQPKIGRFPL